MSSPIIEAKNLSKWYGEVVALNNIDIAIPQGVTGLLGPNGAGKSTFIKLALGLFSPSRGYVHVHGAAPRNNRKVLQQIGYCPEVDQFHETMTGYEFVYWLNRQWGMRKKDAIETAESACERVGMKDRMHDLITTYSKGMRQRIKLAQALAPAPLLLFLDEPMAGLDPRGREEIFGLIRQLGDEGLSVIVSSHILHEVEQVTDQVVLIYNGIVLAQGRVSEIRDVLDTHPRTIRIAGPNLRTLAQEIVGNVDVLGLELGDGHVDIRTRTPNETFEQLNQWLAKPGHTGYTLQCTDDDLQSVFDYLVRR